LRSTNVCRVGTPQNVAGGERMQRQAHRHSSWSRLPISTASYMDRLVVTPSSQDSASLVFVWRDCAAMAQCTNSTTASRYGSLCPDKRSNSSLADYRAARHRAALNHGTVWPCRPGHCPRRSVQLGRYTKLLRSHTASSPENIPPS
jgi:hypothetical protein